MSNLPRLLAVATVVAIAPTGFAQQVSLNPLGGRGGARAWAQVHVEHPCPAPGAQFGCEVKPLDFDGDGSLDLAVGARAEGAAYILMGPLDPRSGFQSVRTFIQNAETTCPVTPDQNQFGYAFGVGQFGPDFADELAVGAPALTLGGNRNAGAVFVQGMENFGGTSLVLLHPSFEPTRFGNSLVGGDFNDDGIDDLAVGAPLADVGGLVAGQVLVFYGPLTNAMAPSLVIDNPNPVTQGNYGHVVTIGDGNADGKQDLLVSAIGNTGSTGIPKAGQVFYYPSPLDPGNFRPIDDPVASASDPFSRFGMHIAARDQVLAVGASRKDWAGIIDVGLGFRFLGPLYNAPTLHEHPDLQFDNLNGFRAVVANLVGDDVLDFGFVTLKRKDMLIFDGNTPNRAPLVLSVREEAADHWANGFDTGNFLSGGHDEIVLGSMHYDAGGVVNSGRISIFYEQ